jgi:hypothetical protein
MMRRLWLVLLLGIAACVPTAADPGHVQVVQPFENLSFYPQETGVIWQYLPEGERLDAMRAEKRIEGPTVLQGQVLIATRLVGRGFDQLDFRDHRSDGVFLVHRNLPGHQVGFDPPLQELPAETALLVGASWGGTTTVTVFSPNARPENQRVSGAVSYRFTVVDKRRVSVVAGEFEVFVINFESNSLDAQGNVTDTLRQTIWFSPHVGKVRHELGLFLVEANF